MQTVMLKNEEIYNIFDTEKFLNRPVSVRCIEYLRSCRNRTLDQYLLPFTGGKEAG